MLPKRDNYAIQSADARRLFLQRDQDAIIRNIPLTADDDHLCFSFFGIPYRIRRRDGYLFRLADGDWIPADSHGEVMTIFDYLCDARPGRALTGSYTPVTNLGRVFHSGLAESAAPSALEKAIDKDPDTFRRVCIDLGGTPCDGGDICFRLLLFPDLPILVRFWHSDEEFPPQLRIFWDSATLDFIRYETVWFASGAVRRHLAEKMAL